MLERNNEKEYNGDVGNPKLQCWIWRDGHDFISIQTTGGHIQTIPKDQSEALKKYLTEESKQEIDVYLESEIVKMTLLRKQPNIPKDFDDYLRGREVSLIDILKKVRGIK